MSLIIFQINKNRSIYFTNAIQFVVRKNNIMIRRATTADASRIAEILIFTKGTTEYIVKMKR